MAANAWCNEAQAQLAVATSLYDSDILMAAVLGKVWGSTRVAAVWMYQEKRRKNGIGRGIVDTLTILTQGIYRSISDALGDATSTFGDTQYLT